MPAESTPTKLQAQKIACVNNAAFVMSFSVNYAKKDGKNGATDGTGNYMVNQTQVIDLMDKGLQAGDTVWPRVSAVAGVSNEGEKVLYAPNGQTVTYSVTGTTLIYSVSRI